MCGDQREEALPLKLPLLNTLLPLANALLPLLNAPLPLLSALAASAAVEAASAAERPDVFPASADAMAVPTIAQHAAEAAERAIRVGRPSLLIVFLSWHFIGFSARWMIRAGASTIAEKPTGWHALMVL